MTKKDKLYSHLELSKNIFDNSKSFYENIINYLIIQSLSNILERNKNYDTITVYHIDSFYRDNSNDKYELLQYN